MSKRVELISNHLSRFPKSSPDPSLDEWRAKGSIINSEMIKRNYLGKYHDFISTLRTFIENNEKFDHFKDLYAKGEELRDRVIQQVAEVVKSFPLDYDKDREFPTLKNDLIFCLAEYDLGVSVRAIVSISLYIDTVTNYGTQKHRNFIDRAFKMQDIGCFAMTELGHGSNVSGVETTATFDRSSRKFVINSPTRSSAKWWIGAAAKTANMSVVFAQLIVDNTNHGVHCFVVPIRNQDFSSIAEVTIGDCGPKMSLNGIDNGFIIFKNYSVDYDCLLDKLSQITPEGKFKSSIKNKEKRLGLMLGGLTRGRSCVVSTSSVALAQATGIAIRFAATRKQFSVGQGPEVPILSYQQHKFRLIPLLSQVFAVRAGYLLLQNMYESNYQTYLNNPEGEELSEFHAILSGLKAVCSWMAVTGIQVCRECCGGLGYSSYSAFGRLRNNQEINSTWEGDNSVLLQQTGKYLLKQIQQEMKGHKLNSTKIQFIHFNPDYKESQNSLSDNLDIQELNRALEHLINFFINISVRKLQENAGKFASDAWNNSQTFYLVDTSRLVIEYILSKELLGLAQNIAKDCEKTGSYLLKLSKLFTLTIIEKNLAALIRSGYDSDGNRKVRDAIISLCEEIGEVSVNLVDSILPGNKTIGSVIGASDGQVYRRMIESVESAPGVYDPPYWLPVLKRIRGME